jgi:hypothetical protein
MAERVDGDPGEQIEVTVAVGIPDITALAAGQDRLRAAIHAYQ